MRSLDVAGMGRVRGRAREACQRVRLPFGRKDWRGLGGCWMGSGTGNSIDYQDHRPYLPGDDPRHIDWAAYARTGHYSMKLYREEVAPSVDVAIDLSASMALEPAKRDRAWELFYFGWESGAVWGATVRAWGVEGERCGEMDGAAVEAGSPWDGMRWGGGGPRWRAGSLRVWVGDLLQPESPEPRLASMVAGRGRGIILAPYAAVEAEPAWAGNVLFADVETGRERVQSVDAGLRERYRVAYGKHFAAWRAGARRRGIAMAQVAAGGGLVEALMVEGLRAGAVEAVG